MKIRAEMGRQRAPLCPPEYQVDRVAEIPNTQFAAFLMRPLDRYDFIRSNQVEPHQGTGHDHCLLVLGEGREDGVLVQCASDGRAAYSAYVAGARDIMQAQLDRAVDYIVRQATENTSNGSWCIYYDELARDLGLTIRDGSGLDTMLVDAMRSRPEVADVVLADECVDAVYYLAYCKNLEEQEDIPTEFSPERTSVSAPMRFCSFSANRKCRKMAGKGVQPLNNYTCRFRPSSLKQADKSGLDGLQTGK